MLFLHIYRHAIICIHLHHTHSCEQTFKHIHEYVCTLSHTHTQTQTLKHTYTYIHIHSTHGHIHTHTLNTRTHGHTYTQHTDTWTHISTQVIPMGLAHPVDIRIASLRQASKAAMNLSGELTAVLIV